MEAGEENGGNVNLKRQRAPLSDSEDNVLSQPEVKDGQKRRRLEAAGQENLSPKPCSFVRLAEVETKPDTPMVPSVRSRVHQLTQRREGGAPLVQRCLSDPGAGIPSAIHEKDFRKYCLGEGEFNQRLERFKVPVYQAGPPPSPSSADPSPRTRSNFVCAIQQKLHGTPASSSKQASRMRQEREQELSQLQIHPISENAWLKRSNSDPSLSQRWTPPGPSTNSSWVPRSRGRVHWPPMQPWDQIDDDAEMKDGSFIEAPTSCAKKQSSDGKGERAPSDSEASLESKISEGQQHMQCKKQNAYRGDAIRGDKEYNASVANEEKQLGSQRPHTQTVLKLSFSEDQTFSRAPFGDEQSLLESTHESNMKDTVKVSTVVEQEKFEVFSFEEIDGSINSEEGIEPSTDEELRSWRYPQDKVCNEENVSVKEEKRECELSRVEKETRVSVSDHSEPLDTQEGECELGDASAEIAGSSEMQEDKKPRPDADGSESCLDASVKHQSNLNTKSCEGFTAMKLNQKDTREYTHRKDMRQQSTEGGESSKKVTFVLVPELINDSTLSEASTSMESRTEISMSDAELSSHDETNTADMIDQMFEEVLDYAGRMEEKRVNEDTEDHDSGIGVFSGDKEKLDTESEKEKSEEDRESKAKECDESKQLESNGDELLTFPSSGILSPLSRSVEAVVTPLRLAASQESNPPSLVLTPEETNTPLAESAPLYSIDAYRTQRQKKLPTIQSVTPGVQRQAPEKSQPQPFVNTKKKIAALNEEAGKLQSVISQTLQALSCCTDEEHGRGSLEEAEAEKLLLVSSEKRSALLAEVVRLREERNSEDAAEEDKEDVSQQACRGTVAITNIQLPLKVEFVCSSHNRTGRPSHYFFVLIRYGPCNIVATPLATAADAQNGDTISFPTSVTLKDIRSHFEIDVEVYSLSHTSATNCSMDRTTTKSRVTPRKLLNTISRASNSQTSGALPALNTRRSSNFCLVGSHKITLASLGHSKFPLDKMKLEGKIRKLLGDEFQEKVPFLSPLEGNIYLQLDSEGHSNVQHQGFLTMFEMISGYGVWHRRYFVLVGCQMDYWNHPNDKETKEAEGSISLSSSPFQSVRPVKRDSCARPFTFELVSNIEQQQDSSQDALARFSADTKLEGLDWMEKLSQALLDFHTWNRTSATKTASQQSNTSIGATLRESIL
ncbi:anillin-like isoform X2 [Etheostoma spectabile]|uniref:anillin-like isoform X1 n=1 Tax=Etheostoma spectabile TaxID=54343 RepID=UPI0013AF6350|nr:anillin-like isoform X1 [Etheostoma spectabile]XP_032378196.1 anillin-like isoform X2 [Etheostoma spectabile]